MFSMGLRISKLKLSNLSTQKLAANEQVFGKVLDKNVPSADGQLLNSYSIAQFLLDCPS